MKLSFLHQQLRPVKLIKSKQSKTLGRPTALLLIACSLASLALPLLGLITPASSVQAAGWWNEDYRYRQQIDVTSDSNQANTYLTLTLDTSDTTKFKNDCSDLRFIDFNNQTIPYYIVSGCGTASTSVQLLFPALPNGTTSLYLYYANPSALALAASQPFNNLATGTSVAYQSEQKSSAPIAYYKFDEGYGTTTHSSTSKDYPGALTNGPTWQSSDMCISGKCLYFDGVDDWVRAPNVPYTNTLSAGTWIKASSWGTSDKYILSRRGASAANEWALSVDTSGRVVFAGWGSGGSSSVFYLQSSLTLETNKWYYLAGTADSTTARLFINGQQTASSAQSGTLYNSGAPLSIGRCGDGLGVCPSDSQRLFNGFIDQPKIYDYARTQAQIQQDYLAGQQQMAAQQSNLSNGLVGYWKMDETSWNGTAAEVKDSSGNNNNGQAMNGAASTNGVYGYGGNLDGTDDSIIIPYTDTLRANQAFSASIWIKNAAVTNNQAVIKGAGGNGYDASWRIITNGSGYSASVMANTRVNVGGGTIKASQWQQVIVTYDQNNLSLFVDGQKIGQSAANGPVVYAATNQLSFGLSNGVGYLQGQLDEARLYNRALTTTEVVQLYTTAPKPVAYYDFEEGGGSTVYDQSTNGNTGTWYGSGTHYANGIIGKSAMFTTSASDGIKVPYNRSLDFDYQDSYSVSFWLKPTLTGAAQEILHAAKGSSSYPYRFYITPANVLSICAYDAANAKSSCTNTVAMAAYDQVWTHFSLVKDASQNCLYLSINGLRQTCVAFTITGSTLGASGSLTIGHHPSNVNYGTSQIDQIKIYNYAQTSDQVIKDMQNGRPLTATPISQWKFDEGQGTTITDSSFNKLTGTLTNTSWVDGVKGKALHFTGSSSYASLGNVNQYKIPDKTISFWAKPSATITATQGIISPASSNWYVGFTTNNGMIFSFGRADGTQQTVSITQVAIPNEWHHYAYTMAVKGSTVIISFYQDGKFLKSTTYTDGVSAAYATPYYLGTFSTASFAYKGDLDDLKIYNAAFTSENIAVDYNQSSVAMIGSTSTQATTSGSGQAATKPSNSADSKYCVPGDTGYCAKPAAEWNFEEGTGATVADSSGNGNTLSVVAGTSWTNGKSGKGMAFDGSNSYMSTGANIPLSNPQSWTYETWFYPKAGSTTVADGLVGQLNNPRLVWGNSGSTGSQKVQALANWTDGSPKTINSGDITLNTWHHAVAVFDNTSTPKTIKLYIDGILVGTSALVSGSLITPQETVYIGRRDNSYAFNGSIDQARVYSYARTAAQVAWSYNQGQPVVNYKFDECSGSTLHDSSPNKFLATLNVGTYYTTAAGNCGTMASTAWGKDKSAKDGASIYFDGQDDYAVGTATGVINPLQGAVSAWVKMGTPQRTLGSGGHYIFSHSQTVNNSRIYLRTWDDGISLGCNLGDGTQIGSGPVVIGQWNHIICGWNGINAVIYVNGRDVTTSRTFNGLSVVAANYYIGSLNSASSESYLGQLDDLRIYNYLPTPTQIQSIYNNGALRWGQ